jgi:hypothetical protein
MNPFHNKHLVLLIGIPVQYFRNISLEMLPKEFESCGFFLQQVGICCSILLFEEEIMGVRSYLKTFVDRTTADRQIAH